MCTYTFMLYMLVASASALLLTSFRKSYMLHVLATTTRTQQIRTHRKIQQPHNSRAQNSECTARKEMGAARAAAAAQK